MALSRLVALAIACGRALAAFDIGFEDDSDLTHFVTRPEIKAPLFNVSIYEPEKISPGYWIVAPYVFIDQQGHAERYYQPCQTGPAIYDGNGELVWSGACDVRNQNTCDLRVWDFNNTQYLSAILTQYRGGNDKKGHGFIMDASYNITQEVHTSTTINAFNMHEFNLIEDGTKAMYLLFDPMRMDLGDLKEQDPDLGFDAGWVADMGFREVDLRTGQIEFEWWAARSRHVSLTESKKPIEHLNGPYPKAWNWFHGNSIEKNSEGDYMISSRFTDTIFKISGEDGHVIWRLGGNHSSFHQNFNFSRQHDARWLSITPDKEVISFLDNASDESGNTSSISSAVVVELDRKHSPGHSKEARIVNQIYRPDGNLTRLRGNHQVLPDKNHFVCWSENSYLSEHSPDGQTLFEAKFASKRFVTYRAYKFNFTGMPTDSPVVKASVYGTSPERATTVMHVSWNGATEVRSWRFRSGGTILGQKARTGFETSLQVDGFYLNVVAEAFDAEGEKLGSSPIFDVVPPAEWTLPATATIIGDEEDDSYDIYDGEGGQRPLSKNEAPPLATHWSQVGLTDQRGLHMLVSSTLALFLAFVAVRFVRRYLRNRCKLPR